MKDEMDWIQKLKSIGSVEALREQKIMIIINLTVRFFMKSFEEILKTIYEYEKSFFGCSPVGCSSW